MGEIEKGISGYTKQESSNLCDNIQVSVVCITYNHANYLKTALDGFAMQKTNFKFEVLIHDDASTDSTPAIIESYVKKYPDLMKPIMQTVNQYSQGVSIGDYMLPYVNGKYVALCEGDDYWCDAHKLQKQYDIMEANPYVALCAHKVQCLNADGTENKRIIPDAKLRLQNNTIYKDNALAKLITKAYCFHTSSYFMRKELLYSKENRELRKYFNGDAAIVMSSIVNGGIYYIDSIMSFRRLWTVRNWNQRFRSESDSYKASYYMKQAQGYVLLDGITKGSYSKYFSSASFTQILMIGVYDIKKARAYYVEKCKQYNFTYSPFLKRAMHQFAFLRLPWLYSIFSKYIRRRS